MDELSTFARQCVDGVCHCDWRIEFNNCAESESLHYIGLINIAIAGFGGLFAFVLLCYRLGYQGHTLWNFGPMNGAIFKPKPVDSMLLFFVIHSILHTLQGIFLMYDLVKSYAFRSFFFEFGFEFAYGSVTVYLIGIAQTISQSRNVSGWLPSPRIVDVFGAIFFFAPFLINTWFSISAGILAESQVQTARILVRVHYAAWTVECFGLGAAVLYAGVRLVRILKGHHNNFKRRGHYATVQSGIFKIQLMVAAFVFAVWAFAFVCLFYFTLREQIIDSTPGSLFMAIIWWNLAGLTIIFAQVIVILSPKLAANAALRSKSSGNSTDEHNTSDITTTNNTFLDESETGVASFKSDTPSRQWAIQERQWQGPNPLNPPSYMQSKAKLRDPETGFSHYEMDSYYKT